MRSRGTPWDAFGGPGGAPGRDRKKGELEPEFWGARGRLGTPWGALGRPLGSILASRGRRFHYLFPTSFLDWFFYGFWPDVGSIFSPFSWFLHNFFEHRFCIDFSLILDGFFFDFSCFWDSYFAHFLEQLIFENHRFITIKRWFSRFGVFRTSSIFHGFPIFFGVGFCIDFSLLLDLIFHHFRSSKRRKIRYFWHPFFRRFLSSFFHGFRGGVGHHFAIKNRYFRAGAPFGGPRLVLGPF